MKDGIHVFQNGWHSKQFSPYLSLKWTYSCDFQVDGYNQVFGVEESSGTIIYT